MLGGDASTTHCWRASDMGYRGMLSSILTSIRITLLLSHLARCSLCHAIVLFSLRSQLCDASSGSPTMGSRRRYAEHCLHRPLMSARSLFESRRLQQRSPGPSAVISGREVRTASCCYYGCPAGNPSCINPCTTVPNGGCGPLRSCALAFCHHETVDELITGEANKRKMGLAEEREVKIGADNLQA